MATTTAIRALPTAAESKEIERALQSAFDLLERVGWAVERADEADSSEYPHPVTFETMGVLADLRASVDMRIDDFQVITRKIDAAMFGIGTILEEQRRAAGGDDD